MRDWVLIVIRSQADKKHFGSYEVLYKKECFSKYILSFLFDFGGLRGRFEIDLFYSNGEYQNDLIKVIVTPFKLFVIWMEDIDNFFKGAVILSRVKSQLFFRKANVFGINSVGNKRTDWCELFWIVCHPETEIL